MKQRLRDFPSGQVNGRISVVLNERRYKRIYLEAQRPGNVWRIGTSGDFIHNAKVGLEVLDEERPRDDLA